MLKIITDPKSLLIIILLLVSTQALAQSQAFTRTEAVGFAEPIGFLEFIDNWQPGSFSGGDSAFAHAWIEAGYGTSDWAFSISLRDHAEARFSRDSAEFFYLISNRLPLEANRSYKVEMNYSRATLLAFRSLFIKRINKLSLKFGSNLFIGKDFTASKVDGEIQPTTDRDYDFNNILMSYRYSEDEIFANHVVKSPVGFGLGFEAEVDWRLRQNVVFSAEVENIFGFLYWYNAPLTTATIDTDNKVIDADGFIKVNPALNGRHSNDSFTQHLPLIVRLNSNWRFYKSIQQINRIFYNEAGYFLNLGFGHESKIGDFNLLYEVKNQAFLFEWIHQYIHFAVLVDDMELSRQKHLEFKFIFQIPF